MTGWMTDNAFEAERQKARVRWSASSFNVSILMATFFIIQNAHISSSIFTLILTDRTRQYEMHKSFALIGCDHCTKPLKKHPL